MYVCFCFYSERMIGKSSRTDSKIEEAGLCSNKLEFRLTHVEWEQKLEFYKKKLGVMRLQNNKKFMYILYKLDRLSYSKISTQLLFYTNSEKNYSQNISNKIGSHFSL